MPRRPLLQICLTLMVAVSDVNPLRAAEPTPADFEFFEKQVRPLLVQNCTSCHGPDKQKGGLRLDSRAAVLKGGDTGPAIESGAPDTSLLVESIGYTGDYKMPPKGKLPGEQIAILTEWVKRGAPWPAEAPPAETVQGTGSPKEAFNLAARRAKQWAFQPLHVTEPPLPAGTTAQDSPIDRFIVAQLAAKELKPAPPADKRTLLRRVTYDLIGLPPTPAEIDQFLADNSPDAFAKVVDRLLASPHYGERWARHWLDLVRYAETAGHEFDFEYPQAFEYRDYVIRALNADVPYNQFVVEHVAGDLLPQPRRHPVEKFNESAIGTGFFFLGEAKHSPVDIRGDEAERIDNQIDTLSKAFLGQTVACARCHDHKFDAISTKDYYALAGFLQSSRYHVTCVDAPQEREAIAESLAKLAAERQVLLKRFVSEAAPTALAKLPDYLLAARDVLSAKGGATKSELPAADLEKLVHSLRETALKDPADLFHAWAVLATAATEGKEAFAAKKQELLRAFKQRAEKSAADQSHLVIFEDFGRPDFDGWFVEGEAFGRGPVPVAFVAPKSEFPWRSPSLGVATSGALSPRLKGALRSRTFTIEKNHILYRVAGKETRINLIIDGFQQIRNPIYGGLTIAMNDANLKWYSQNVSKWVGHKAYIEFLDQGPGYIDVDTIAFSDGGPPSVPPQPLVVSMLEDPAVDSLESLAHGYRHLLESAAQKWGTGTADALSGDRAEVVSWLLNRDLPCTLHAATTAPQPASANQSAVGQMAALDAKARELEGQIHYRRTVMGMTDGTPEDESVHLRGSHKKLGEVVPRRLLEAIAGDHQPVLTKDSGRLDLAQRMVDPSNALLQRVIVNRVWKHHFGEGIVRSVDDFGNMGQPPSHPELLDWLASEFTREGWSLKKLHRLMLLTKTYQMSSRPDDARAEEIDPQNKLWHRMPIRRLEGEIIRDAMLATSGTLQETLFGPSVMPYLTPNMAGRGRPGTSGPLDGAGRRSIYLGVRRNFLIPMFLAFDYPIPAFAMGRRSVSNVPAQALALMNNPFVVEQAEVWAKRVAAQHADSRARIAAMYVAAYGRPPDETELQSAVAFIADQTKPNATEAEKLHAWADLAHVLMNVKEFIFVN